MFAGTSTRTPTSSSGTTPPTVPRLPPPRPTGWRVRSRPASTPQSRYGRSAARIIAARSRAPRASSSPRCVAAWRAGLRVALAQHRHDELLVEAGLALDRRPPRPQVAGVDAGAQEAAGGGGDLDRLVAVQVAARALRDDAVLLELGELVRGHRRHRAQLVAVDEHAGQQAGRRARWSAAAARRRRPGRAPRWPAAPAAGAAAGDRRPRSSAPRRRPGGRRPGLPSAARRACHAAASGPASRSARSRCGP